MSAESDNLEERTEDEPFVILDDEPSDDTISSEITPEVEDELDGLRIRQLVHLRRSNIRSQTYAVVGMIGCAVAATKLFLLAYHQYVDSDWMYAGAYFSTGIAGVVGALIFAFNADRLRAELKHTGGESEHVPDFDPLSDGSHHVTNLHEMHENNSL